MTQLSSANDKGEGVESVRIEKDFLGEKSVPHNAYYGIQTVRALENFAITGMPISHFPSLIVALAQVKKASAMANASLGKLSSHIADAICDACDEIIHGELHSSFVVDVVQGGAGTSTNMNANEVIANRALELLGHQKGDYHIIHPNNHVNMSQSTNDVYPTAFRIALYEQLGMLEGPLLRLQRAFERKAASFERVVKMGRTQLQDAVPMTLGQEFYSFACMIKADIEALNKAKIDAKKMNLGGTAIGTGINTPKEYKVRVIEYLSEVTQQDFSLAEDLITATQDTSVFVQISGLLKRIAVKVSKICNDLRLLSSGPRAGLNEINLPAMQPGSSIMPGKVNPVIPEVVNQVAYDVIGGDVTITMAAEAGQLQLNVFEPMIMYRLFHSMNMLSRSVDTLTEKCIDGIEANEDVCLKWVESSVGIVTALTPKLGYQMSSDIAKAALKQGVSVRDIVLQQQLLTEAEVDVLLDPQKMLEP